jgi:mRNA interferase MazF
MQSKNKMAILYHPDPGTILRCDFSRFKVPEMVEHRPVVIISPRLRERDGLCTIVPLSTTPPETVMPWHYKIQLSQPLSKNFSALECWAKCDMVTTIGHHRLDRFSELIPHTNQRRYYEGRLTSHQFKDLMSCVHAYLGLAFNPPL